MNTTYRHLATVGMAIALTVLTGCQVPPNNQSVDDAQITAQVNQAFINDAVYQANQVRVETFNGVVQLSGTVPTRLDVTKVEEMVKTIKGVKEIRNNLQVR
jgi:hyperosmotically inducible protein